MNGSRDGRRKRGGREVEEDRAATEVDSLSLDALDVLEWSCCCSTTRRRFGGIYSVSKKRRGLQVKYTQE